MEIRILVTIMLLLFASKHGTNAESDTGKLTKCVNNFSLKLYNELIKNNDNNLFCSGYSFSVALNMLLVGAKGNTADEIRNVFGYNEEELTQEQIENAFQTILSEQIKNHTGYEFDVANSMWIHSGSTILDHFKSTLQNKFYSEDHEVTFGSPEATAAINDWVKKATKGKIPELFEKTLDSLVRLVLVNAIYFKGTWETTFNHSLTADFPFKYRENNSPSEKSIKMMNMHDERFPYLDSDELDSHIIQLPYNGNEVGMVIILPHQNTELSEVEQKLTVDKLNAALDKMDKTKIHLLRIPKFETSSTLNLEDVLQAMGIKDAFDEGKADLSGIDGKGELYVSKAIQKANIEVSEEGTVASVASGINASIRTIQRKPIVFIADRPFIYLIRHKGMGMNYFMGRYNKP